MKGITQLTEDIRVIIDDFDWHQPAPDPSITIKMIEAKAKLMEARKKLLAVIKIGCDNE